MTFFEAPHRIVETLRDAADYLGNRPIMVGRELTKMHQEFLRGTASELSRRFEARAKGEITIVVGPLTNSAPAKPAADDADIALEFSRITNSGALSRRAAIASTAKNFGISAKQVYAAIERAKTRLNDKNNGR